MDVGVEERDEVWEWLGCGEDAEGLVESSVVTEGLVEVFGGLWDDAQKRVA